MLEYSTEPNASAYLGYDPVDTPRSYNCVKECSAGWGIWPAYDMCVPCVPGCDKCDGYPTKEYTELVDTYGKDLADEIQQGYTYLGMLEFGPMMTEYMFEPTC